MKTACVLRISDWSSDVCSSYRLAGTLEYCFYDGFLVDRHVESLAHLHIVEGRLLRVVSQVADVEAFLLQQVDVRIGLHRLDVGRVRIRHHVALAGLQLLVAHAGVRRDGEEDRKSTRLNSSH